MFSACEIYVKIFFAYIGSWVGHENYDVKFSFFAQSPEKPMTWGEVAATHAASAFSLENHRFVQQDFESELVSIFPAVAQISG